MIATRMSLMVMPCACMASAMSANLAVCEIAFTLNASPSVAQVVQVTIPGGSDETGISDNFEARMSVEPTGVEPTGVEPTGEARNKVEPTGVDPTGAEPSCPATSICSTLVSGVAFVQLPPLSGIFPSGPHQAENPPESAESGVLPSSRDDQWTLRKSVVAKLTSLSGSAASLPLAVEFRTTSASVSAFNGWFARDV